MANYNEMPEPAIRITDKSMIGRLYDTMQDFFYVLLGRNRKQTTFL